MPQASDCNQGRRRLLTLTGSVLGLGAVAWAARPAGTATRAPQVPAEPPAAAPGDVAPLVRMQQDLQHALRKPADARRWAMAIDVRKCVGCRACVVACKAEHVSPPSVSYRHVFEVEIGDYPDVQRIFMPTNCMQCDEPPCMAAAPPGAITKRPDGIVVFDATRLRGRDLFERVRAACPYTAVSLDEGDRYTAATPAPQRYEERPSYAYGRVVPQASAPPPVETIRKCDFCLHRLDAGVLPACVTTCIGGAMSFGDANDPESTVSRVLSSAPTVQINDAERIRPRVWHLASDRSICAACH
jgi:tetrathionate reductase subunit B